VGIMMVSLGFRLKGMRSRLVRRHA
jgi:hypothetical protein